MSVEKIITPMDAQAIIFEMMQSDFPEQYKAVRCLIYDPTFENECNAFLSKALMDGSMSVLKQMSNGAWRVFFERAVQHMAMFLKAEGRGIKSIATVPYSATKNDLKIFLIGAVLLQSELPFPPESLPLNENRKSSPR